MPSLSPLLSNFAPEDLSLLSSYGEAMSYAPGQVVIAEGEPNRYLYLVLKGKLEVVKGGESSNATLATIGTSGSFGEMSVFDPGPTSATVRASGEVEVWRITAENMERLHETKPKVAYRLVSRICSCLAHRLRALNDKFVDATTYQ